MLATLIEINPSSIGYITGYITETYDSVQLLIFLAIGLPLGFYVARKLITLVRAR